MHTEACICVYTHTCYLYTHTCIPLCTYMCVLSMHTGTYTHMCIYPCVYVYIHVCIYTYILYMYIYTYTHTHEVCPEVIQPCSMKIKTFIEEDTRYKKHRTQGNDVSVPFEVGTLGPHTVLPTTVGCPFIFSWISSMV